MTSALSSGKPTQVPDPVLSHRVVPWIPPRLRKPWTSAVPRILLEWHEDRRSEGFAPSTCLSYALDVKDLASFLTVPLKAATAADLRAYRGSLLGRPSNQLPVPGGSRRSGMFYDWLRICRDEHYSIAQDLRPTCVPDHVHRWWTPKQVKRLEWRLRGILAGWILSLAVLTVLVIGIQRTSSQGHHLR